MLEVKNIFKQEKGMLQLTFNPGLTAFEQSSPDLQKLYTLCRFSSVSSLSNHLFQSLIEI